MNENSNHRPNWREQFEWFSRFIHVLIVAQIAVVALMALPALAHMKGMFDTQAAAEARAAQLKCKGAFKMGDKWLPCANERALHEALQRQ